MVLSEYWQYELAMLPELRLAQLQPRPRTQQAMMITGFVFPNELRVFFVFRCGKVTKHFQSGCAYLNEGLKCHAFFNASSRFKDS